MPPRVARGGASKRGATVGTGKAKATRGKQAGANVRGGKAGTSKKTPAPEKPKWSGKQIESVIKIQNAYRLFKQRKMEEKERKKKETMDRLIEEAERDAWLKVIKIEKEKEDREHEKWLQLERERKAHLKRMKMILENAFDGELEEIQRIIQEAVDEFKNNAVGGEIHPTKLSRKTMELIECMDANEYTALSEAGAGGASQVIAWLVSEGADPNSRGLYGRTPLYRAAFGGHVESVQQFLQCGADPGIRADDGATPADISTNAVIKEILLEWDTADTERLLQNLALEQDKRASAQAEYVQMKVDAIQDQISAAEETFKIHEKQLICAYTELNKRIYEHDLCVEKGTHVEVTLHSVHEAEDEVSILKLKAEDSRKDLQLLRLQLREEQKMKAEEDPVGVKVTVRELEDVLIRDVGNKISEDGRWPLIVDETGQASIFVRYSDTNYLNAVNPGNMEPERIRMALLGAVRFGKPLVIDFMGCDMFHVVKDRFDEIKPGLLDWVIDKTLVTEEKFNQITKKEDGPEYEEKMFWARMGDFKFWLMTNAEPIPELLEMFYVIRVKPAPPKE